MLIQHGIALATSARIKSVIVIFPFPAVFPRFSLVKFDLVIGIGIFESSHTFFGCLGVGGLLITLIQQFIRVFWIFPRFSYWRGFFGTIFSGIGLFIRERFICIFRCLHYRCRPHNHSGRAQYSQHCPSRRTREHKGCRRYRCHISMSPFFWKPDSSPPGAPFHSEQVKRSKPAGALPLQVETVANPTDWIEKPQVTKSNLHHTGMFNPKKNHSRDHPTIAVVVNPRPPRPIS